ncbi:hypothetical protein LP421_32425 (plasmid) [Rhizobium sp. RCAM05350]|nr:hypothetical protein LP421_32425 [Rhizobium sp. RCAM05350]
MARFLLGMLLAHGVLPFWDMMRGLLEIFSKCGAYEEVIDPMVSGRIDLTVG